MGHEFSDDEDRRTAVGEMVSLGARESIMTLRRRLPRACSRTRASAASTGPRSSRSSRCPRSGSGDAFLAGFAAARYGGRDAEACLRFAVACGAESTQHFGAGVLDAARGRAAGARGAARDEDAPAVHVG